VDKRLSAMSDEELMGLVADGHAQAFEALFARYRAPVTSLCHRFLRDRDKAENAAQETFLRLLQHRDKYQRGHKAATWILSIAANLCRDLLKRKDRTTLDGLEEMPIQPVAAGETPHDGAERAEMTALLGRAIDRLDPIYQEIIVLRVFQGLSYKEISDMTGCNESTARSRMELALKQLRRLMAPKRLNGSAAKG
jgi:RNA polymerase sigma-70 factor (ECF subfamily)